MPGDKLKNHIDDPDKVEENVSRVSSKTNSVDGKKLGNSQPVAVGRHWSISEMRHIRN